MIHDDFDTQIQCDELLNEEEAYQEPEIADEYEEYDEPTANEYDEYDEYDEPTADEYDEDMYTEMDALARADMSCDDMHEMQSQHDDQRDLDFYDS